MTTTTLRTCLFAGLLLALVSAAPTPARAAVTECDMMATHPFDPDKPLPGIERPQIDLPRAEAACRAAVATDPRSARAWYQLGRVLFYQKKTGESLRALERSAAIGYRQAIFVLGFVYYDGGQVPKDDCRAAKLWEQSIGLEHPWTGYYLLEGYLDGRFEKCGLRLSDADLDRYFAVASTRISVVDSEGRIEKMRDRLAARARATEAETKR